MKRTALPTKLWSRIAMFDPESSAWVRVYDGPISINKPFAPGPRKPGEPYMLEKVWKRGSDGAWYVRSIYRNWS